MISLKLKNITVTTEDPAFVMAIVNATPDSFWKESRGGIELALKAIEEGAHICLWPECGVTTEELHKHIGKNVVIKKGSVLIGN